MNERDNITSEQAINTLRDARLTSAPTNPVTPHTVDFEHISCESSIVSHGHDDDAIATPPVTSVKAPKNVRVWTHNPYSWGALSDSSAANSLNSTSTQSFMETAESFDSLDA